MASYRESLVAPERGREFMSPLCGEPIPAQFSESMLPPRKESQKESVIPESKGPRPTVVPLSESTHEWFKFPTYSHMLQHRVYEAGSPIIENEAGYPEELLRFREEKAKEFQMASAIQTGDYNENFENKAQVTILNEVPTSRK